MTRFHLAALLAATLGIAPLPALAQDGVTLTVTLSGARGLPYEVQILRGQSVIYRTDGASGGRQSFAIPGRTARRMERYCVALDPEVAFFQTRSGTRFDLLCNTAMSGDNAPGAAISLSGAVNAAN